MINGTEATLCFKKRSFPYFIDCLRPNLHAPGRANILNGILVSFKIFEYVKAITIVLSPTARFYLKEVAGRHNKRLATTCTYFQHPASSFQPSSRIASTFSLLLASSFGWMIESAADMQILGALNHETSPRNQRLATQSNYRLYNNSHSHLSSNFCVNQAVIIIIIRMIK